MISNVPRSSTPRILLSALCVLWISPCEVAHAQETRAFAAQRIALSNVADGSPERWTGLTNIFFAAPSDSQRTIARFDDDWSSVELADVVTGKGVRSIVVARFKRSGSDSVRYVIDTTGRLDFRQGQVLDFRRQRQVWVADVELNVQTAGGRGTRIPYQILLSDDHYSYARIAEYRTGNIIRSGRRYPVVVRRASRDHPFFSLDTGIQLLVDMDGDGKIAEQVAVTGDGRPLAAEEVMPGAPFVLAGQVLEFSRIDSLGTALFLRPSRTRVAAVEGLKAPPLQGRDLANSPYELRPASGQWTLVEFWSTQCAFSEKARPELNALSSELAATNVQWLGVSRERDPLAVKEYLREHPMSGRIVLPDSTSWATYNPAGITPLFLLLDDRGIVRYRAAGASSVSAVMQRAMRARDMTHPKAVH